MAAPATGFYLLDARSRQVFSAMDKYVVTVQFALEVKRLGTDGTAVCRCAVIVGVWVKSHVPLQRIQPDKLLATHTALVRQFLSVGPVMAAQLGNCRKILPTEAARVWF